MSIEHAQIHPIEGNLLGGEGICAHLRPGVTSTLAERRHPGPGDLGPCHEESVGGDVDVQHDHAPLPRQLRVLLDRGHTVLEFHGEIDILAAVDITPFLDSATGGRAPRIVIDLRPVEFFDCSGLRLLYRARRRVIARAGQLYLVCTDPLTLRILRVTGLAGLLPPLATLDEALGQPEATSGSL